MKKSNPVTTFTLLFLLMGVVYVTAEESVKVASFPMQPLISGEKIPDDLLYRRITTGDDFGGPLLIKRGLEFGICDILGNRIFWLNADFKVRKVSPMGAPLGTRQGDGYTVVVGMDSVTLYKDSLKRAGYFGILLPDQTAPTRGGAWYQSDTLFFWDEQGTLQVIEHPIDGLYPHTGVNSGVAIKDADYARNLVQRSKDGRFSGLVWSNLYGLMRNGIPLARTYNHDWQVFLADQRKKGDPAATESFELFPENYKNAITIFDALPDGTLYWGGNVALDVVRDGKIVRTIPVEDLDGPIVLPDGSILSSKLNIKTQVFDLLLLKKDW